MESDLPTPAFHTCRVRQTFQGTPPGVMTHGYRVERRSRWWPFWRATKGFYESRSEAIAMAQAYVLVQESLHRAVHEPDVVWRG
ncbi:hypothetical protein PAPPERLAPAPP_05040 [Brevundimonas phage vB_BpoS-Papperlapapp]|nr:hypothetical protein PAPPERLAPAPP_05040 [Brevundimonas phage vB_BpoS-Papperlapapp]